MVESMVGTWRYIVVKSQALEVGWRVGWIQEKPIGAQGLQDFQDFNIS